jgi:hypothetical protein
MEGLGFWMSLGWVAFLGALAGKALASESPIGLGLITAGLLIGAVLVWLMTHAGWMSKILFAAAVFAAGGALIGFI